MIILSMINLFIVPGGPDDVDDLGPDDYLYSVVKDPQDAGDDSLKGPSFFY